MDDEERRALAFAAHAAQEVGQIARRMGMRRGEYEVSIEGGELRLMFTVELHPEGDRP